MLPTQGRPCGFTRLDIYTTAYPLAISSVGMSMAGTVAGIVSALGGPAAPIVMPIVGLFVLAKWVYDVYQQS